MPAALAAIAAADGASGLTAFVLPKKPRIGRRPTPPRKHTFTVVPIAALTDKRLTDRNRTILAMICSFANRAGITWVTQKIIGDQFGIKQQSVQKVFKKLRDAGYLEKLSGHKAGIKGSTYRIVYDPSITLDDALSIAGNGIDEDPPNPLEDPIMNNFRHGQPQPLGAFLPEIEKMKKRQAKPAEAQQQQQHQAVEATKLKMGRDYVNVYVAEARRICGVERVPNEQDVHIGNELAAAAVPWEAWQQIIRESLTWHQQAGKQPPLGLGYYRSVALNLREAL